MSSNIFFVKSLEEDFYTKILKGKKKVNFQSIKNIVATKTIRPNTRSFGQKSRLSTTIVHKNYLKTYRSQGIIFQTKASPLYVLPFDLVVLSDAKKIVVHYYRIKNNLHLYYNHKLIPGYERFIFKNLNQLVSHFPTHDKVWKELNSFREKAGYKPLPASKKRLLEYNEAVFEKTIKITPVAIFGYNLRAKKVAVGLGLPHYRTAKDFYKKNISTA